MSSESEYAFLFDCPYCDEQNSFQTDSERDIEEKYCRHCDMEVRVIVKDGELQKVERANTNLTDF